MNALLIAVLATTASCLIGFQRRPWWAAVPGSGPAAPAGKVRRRPPSPEALPRLVRQLASLLAAGRTGPPLWQALALVVAMDHDRMLGGLHNEPRGSPGRLSPQHPNTRIMGLRHTHEAGSGRDANPTLLLVISVQRTSELGLPSAAAIRAACHPHPTRLGSFAGMAGTGTLAPEERRLWLDIAACFEVCEASGAPVAGVLERLAGTLEADQDAAGQRETALAGPRATVRLLTWLPLVGLGLGMLMGVDPLGALLGSPVGWSVLAAGVGCAAVGRGWSARMIRQAASPAPASSRR